MRIKYLFAILTIPTMAFAAEGMWTLDNLPKEKMQAEYGFAPDDAWVKHVMRSAVRIAGGCSGSFISKDGLVMTNHHCAAQCVGQLSTAKKDFIRDGFLAATREQEVLCPEIELNRLEEITDVTAQVKKATAKLNGSAFQKAQNAIRAKLSADCVGADKATTRCDVVDLYHGGRYHLYKYHRFQDTRLVWAPEQSIANFGGDPDNFNFPRYNLDATLIRAYENGKPAVIKDFFPFSKNGAKENELVITAGHPGRTQRQLTIAQLVTLRDHRLTDGLIRSSELRGVLTQYMKTGAEAERTAHEPLFFLENGIKARLGQLKALHDPELIRQKQADETALRRFVASKPALKAKIGGAWDAIAKAQTVELALDKPYNAFEKGRAFASTYFEIAHTLVRGAAERVKPNGQRFPEFNDTKLLEVEQELFSDAPIYPDFEKLRLGFSLTKMREDLGTDDPMVKMVLGKQAPEHLAAALVSATKLGDIATRKALWTGGIAAIMQSDDPFIKLALAVDPAARVLRARMEKEVTAVTQKNAELIAQARFVQQGLKAYPDATFSLRLSYGAVKGWQEAGRTIAPFTTTAGLFERDTGADPFLVPASWNKAKPKLDLALPMNFVSDNDIIGGNSGSPIINRNAEVVGLVFDGNIHSLGGAFWFDKRLNRTVSVHSGFILEALDKVYGGDAIKREILAQ
jgi:hypothetical protein